MIPINPDTNKPFGYLNNLDILNCDNMAHVNLFYEYPPCYYSCPHAKQCEYALAIDEWAHLFCTNAPDIRGEVKDLDYPLMPQLPEKPALCEIQNLEDAPGKCNGLFSVPFEFVVPRRRPCCANFYEILWDYDEREFPEKITWHDYVTTMLNNPENYKHLHLILRKPKFPDDVKRTRKWKLKNET